MTVERTKKKKKNEQKQVKLLQFIAIKCVKLTIDLCTISKQSKSTLNLNLCDFRCNPVTYLQNGPEYMANKSLSNVMNGRFLIIMCAGHTITFISYQRHNSIAIFHCDRCAGEHNYRYNYFSMDCFWLKR